MVQCPSATSGSSQVKLKFRQRKIVSKFNTVRTDEMRCLGVHRICTSQGSLIKFVRTGVVHGKMNVCSGKKVLFIEFVLGKHGIDSNLISMISSVLTVKLFWIDVITTF